MNRLTFLVAFSLALFSVAHGSFFDFLFKDSTQVVRSEPKIGGFVEPVVHPKKPCRGKGKRKCGDDEDDEMPMESEEPMMSPEGMPAMCPESYMLKGKRCKLESGAGMVDATVVAPTECPRRFTLEDGMCKKGKASKKPKCPKKSRPSKKMCLVCETPAKPNKKGMCRLPKTVMPTCMEGYSLSVMDGMAMCYRDM